MLRPYKHIHSKLHRANSFVNHIMLDIIFIAPKINSPSFSSLLALPQYRKLIDDVNHDYILNPLSELYLICKSLNRYQLKTLKRAVHVNNKVRELCRGDIRPVTYDDIDAIDNRLKTPLKAFCDKLYDNVLGLEPCYTLYEKVDVYYKTLVKRSSVCRCCGLNKVLTQFHTHRSALDHYLPRKHYPFNSVNLKNLLPICDICNSKYKLGEDPLLKITNKGKSNETKEKKRAFYPFRRTDPNIDIKITLKDVISLQSLEPKNIEMDLSCVDFSEEVETWDRLFGVKETYKAECCTDEMLGYFEEQYIADMLYGKTHQEYINILNANKYADGNFLKISFLSAIVS